MVASSFVHGKWASSDWASGAGRCWCQCVWTCDTLDVARRALGVSVSGALVFWATRQLGAEGAYRPIVVAAAVATVCAAVTGLAQAYGIETDFFSLNRAPGGTFGNRNFVAHFCAIGLPSLIYATVTARRPFGALLGSLGAGAVAAVRVLS